MQNFYDDLILPEEFLQPQEESVSEVIEKTLKYYHWLNADIAWLDTEMARLNDMKKSIQWKAERAKSYVDFLMQTNDIQVAKYPTCAVWYRKSTYVDIVDNTILPDDYITVTTTTAPDKNKITEALKSWQDVPWARLWERMNIQIK